MRACSRQPWGESGTTLTLGAGQEFGLSRKFFVSAGIFFCNLGRQALSVPNAIGIFRL